MGLPGTGKTTLADAVAAKLSAAGTPVSRLNADDLRRRFADWDFSAEGRMRQAARMADLADEAVAAGRVAVCDFVCPTEALRRRFADKAPPGLVVWMDTLSEGRFADTNALFEPPTGADYRICGFDDRWADTVAAAVAAGERPRRFDPRQPTVQMLGRWQPWHDGHTALFERAVAKTGQVCVMVRDCQGWGDNPFGFQEVERNIHKALSLHFTGKYTVQRVPNIVEIVYGRKVGYKITEEHLPENIESISATAIRAAIREKSNEK
jgi:hypothetical protein